MAVRERAEAVLRRLAGEHARLRDDQWRAIEALVVDRRRVLCVQRTGWGKSAVYFVATALLRAARRRAGRPTAGPTVIVSPLLALMRNQVEAAARAGIQARTINSANLDEWDEITAEIAAGAVDVLLISPERLNNPDFRDNVLPRLAATTGLLVVDEAHCVSDWGHDFRPDYRRLRTFLADLPAGTPVLATTATANERVTDDVAEQLGDALVLRGPLDRDSLRLAVLDLPSPAHRLAWLADHLDRLPGSGIIYTLTVAAASETAEFLRSRGYAGRRLHRPGRRRRPPRRRAGPARQQDQGAGGDLGAGHGLRQARPRLRRPPRRAAVADRLLPAGRPRRPGRRAAPRCCCCPAPRTRRSGATSRRWPSRRRSRCAPCSRALAPPTVHCRHRRWSRWSTCAGPGSRLMLKVLDVDGAVRRVRGGWVATGEPWAYDDRPVAPRRAGAHRRADRPCASTSRPTGCRMEFLRRCLDDPDAAPCGRCDRCAGAAVRRRRLRRRRWPPRTRSSAGPASRSRRRSSGRPGWRRSAYRCAARSPPASRRCPAGPSAGSPTSAGAAGCAPWSAPDAADGAVPDDVAGAVVEVLKAWAHGDDPWPARPVAVVAIGSRRRPAAGAQSLAERIADGRPAAAARRGAGPGAASGGAGPRGNSAQRVRALHDAFAVPPPLAAALAELTGPVLLVDDLVDSGWTMTMVDPAAAPGRRPGRAAAGPGRRRLTRHSLAA